MPPHPLELLGLSDVSNQRSGIYSVCSAHPLVLEAAVRQAAEDGTPLLVEATSNQVNQFGGYTGMRPSDFRRFVEEIAHRHGLPTGSLILGGDHLGPNPWQHLPAPEAMRQAEEMVAEYSRAGFVKIHLDASMPCHGEQAPLPEMVIAERAARLCRAAEENSGGESRFYVIGTEVPVPGGATESLDELSITTRRAARKTLAFHEDAFAAAGLQRVWPRVIALVVQPGVEFNHDTVIDYVTEKTEELRSLLGERKGLVFEAHSTDYQAPQAYASLVHDGFAILKVGPALTFAMREALFALADIEEEVIPIEKRSFLPEVLEEIMLAEPGYWEKHYHGTPRQQHVLRRFSYSDRIRYYWPQPRVQSAVDVLLRNLTDSGVPETLLSSALPGQYKAVRRGKLQASPHELVIDHIRAAIQPYADACRQELVN